MIIKIKIDGFKSLLDTELYFGPFTCIAGSNAAGKSNFFDALFFLAKLSDLTIIDAAKSIRSENQKHSDIKDLFFRNGKKRSETMKFEIDMLIPSEGEDDLGQYAKATITSLRYILELKINEGNTDEEPIEILREELNAISQKEFKSQIHFYKNEKWLSSVLKGKRPVSVPFISTDKDKIKLHQDGSKGRTTGFTLKKMPRTLLSTTTAESPTAFLVRKEMRSWTMLQFEPSALREPNSIYEVKNSYITSNGNNLAATLFRLNNERRSLDVFQSITNKLKLLIPDVKKIFIDHDEKRDLLTLNIEFNDGLIIPAQSLSDGTLRFLALVIMQQDNSQSNLICLEEPENGINPLKINQMINLLNEISVDCKYKIDEENPLRQVIINTHSPNIVSAVSDESLYLAKNIETSTSHFKNKLKHTTFLALPNTWKTIKCKMPATTLGEIKKYLGNNIFDEYSDPTSSDSVFEKRISVKERVTQLELELL